MYTALFHTHRLVVSIFLALYFIKMILLLMNKKEQLTNFRKWTKVPEIIVSTLFLVTGIWMLILKPTMSIFQVIKLAAVVAAIPCGVIGFVRGNKILGVLSFVLIVAAYGLAEMGKKFVQKVDLGPEIVTDIDAKEYDQLRHGEALYREYCKSCHGPDGKLGLGGAYDLATSRLSDSDAMTIMMNGKGTMPGFKQVLTQRDADAVLEYIKTLRTE
jgi:mono/diheme cytochrome c family protein